MNLVGSLQKASDFLDRHEVPSPRLDAELLLCHITSLSRMDLYLNYDRPLLETETDRYRDLLVRRAKRVPLQLLTGTAYFRGLELKVEPGVFIPRPETEVLVERALEAADILGDLGPLRVLDLGTGCGPIALSFAGERPEARVVATDVDPRSLETARENVLALGLEDRVRLVKSDLFKEIGDPDSYHLVVSNPPYVAAEEYSRLPPEVAEHEPKGALWGGEDGLDVIREIIRDAPGFLEEGGFLLLEVGETQAESVVGLMESTQLLESPMAFGDLAGKKRVVRARRQSG